MSTRKKIIHVEILSEYCKGCGLCVSVCEQEQIEIDPTPNGRGIQTAVCRSERTCTGCLRCTAICPEAAIEICRIDARLCEKETIE